MSLKRTIYKRYEYARCIARGRGGMWVRYYLGAALSHYVHGASPENYFVLRFFQLSGKEKKEFLTSGRSKKVDYELNLKAQPKDKSLVGNKKKFNEAFSHMNQRAFLYTPDVGFKEVVNFIKKYKSVYVKTCGGSRGEGIRKIAVDDITDYLYFYKKCQKEKVLLEEVITQHPLMNEIHSDCVNTVRIIAARDGLHKIHLIGAALRCGCGTAVVDNFHKGGIAYPIDLDKGIICGAGRDNTTLTEYEIHPGSSMVMRGLLIPYWEVVKSSVCAGMDVIPSLGYVGWDIAVTTDGVEVIEANYNWPGGNIIQFDGIGKYPAIQACINNKAKA